MINVYVWLPKQENSQKYVGHASLLVNGFSYISWWPAEEPSELRKDYSPIRNRNYDGDVQGEGRKPDCNIDLTGLDERSILRWWQSFGLMNGNQELQGPLPPYNILGQNCSTVVAKALKIGGGERYAGWYSSVSIVWRPKTVLDFATSIKRGLARK